MSAPTRQEIHSLYRSYLRIVREWPSDKIRPNRGMKQILAKRVEETFRAPNTETIDIEKAHKELDALESLLDNTFKEKVSVLSVSKRRSGFVNATSNCSTLYQTRSLHQQEILITTQN